ncbi:MAG: sulfatase-like hydrolase/transferase [Bacteroidales bacterium]|nr:sulfatase-like hydrolase/transferase [Bacteroidales bacterium]MDD4385514.1 sulfatase-like hydrolase/transferase [Bacteroidales bacterium]MDY0197964.1 sulfatase-like hydrolase/transferase [Tenuifilaceae bacterium]
MLSSIRVYFTDIRFRKSIYTTAIVNILLVYVIFSVSRVLFYLFNVSYFPNVTFGSFMWMMLGGLKFDTSGILYTNLLYLVLILLPFTFRYNRYYQTGLKYLFVITNSLTILANCADFIYFKFTLRRTTASVFGEFENEQNMFSLLLKFLVDYWYIFLIWIIFTAVLILLYQKAKLINKPKGALQHVIYTFMGTLLMALFIGLTIGGLRGGFRHSTRPITLSNAGAFVNDPLETVIVLNTPFAIYRTIGVKPLSKINFYKDEESLNKIFSPVHNPQNNSAFKPQNVVIIILESLGREYIGRYNQHLYNGGYKGYTPFIDSLIDHSLMFRYGFSNGRKSIDVLPSVLASIPMIVEPFVLTPYSSNRINSFASLLKPKGYHTSFFHGAPNGSMGLQAFTRMTGFDKYYGMTEYDNSADFDGMWGIWDEEFLQFFAKEIDSLPQPFFTSIFTISSHHPFRVPERYEGVFPKGELPMHQCVGYTDYALKLFFEVARTKPWFDSTLFVITADHANQPFYDEYKTKLGAYAVPIIFYHPSEAIVGVSQKVAQQIDIMPTVLSYLKFDMPYFAFGKDLLSDESGDYAISYTGSTYQFVNGDTLLHFNGEKIVGAYNYKTDILLKNNLVEQDSFMVGKNEQLLKAIIQQYHNRMIEDRLLPEKQ